MNEETVIGDVEEIIREYKAEFAPAVCKSLDTWTGRMEAICAGVIDFDDVEPVALACAAVADEKDTADSPTWTERIEALLEHFVAFAADQDGEPFKAMCQTFRECGHVADQPFGPEVKRAVEAVLNYAYHDERKDFMSRNPAGANHIFRSLVVLAEAAGYAVGYDVAADRAMIDSKE
jgi:hypothetical protein